MRTNREKYQAAFRVLHTSEDFQVEIQDMKRTRWLQANRFAAKAAAALCVLALGSVTAFAAARFLTPTEIAQEVGDQKLAAALQSEDAVEIGETQEFDKYNVTLLGMVSGKDLTDGKTEAQEGEFHDDRTYVVCAIERTDGGEVGVDDSFFVSPLIDGYDRSEVNIATLLGGYKEMISDDGKVMYHIADMDNIEPFADHRIHLAVQSGGFFDDAVSGEIAYRYDEATEAYSRETSFDGVNALFDLPVDPAKADPAKAAEILEGIRESGDDTAVYVEGMYAVTPENIREKADPVSGTWQTITPDENGVIEMTCKLENGYTTIVTDTVDNLFPDGKTDTLVISSIGESGDETGSDIYLDTFTLHPDRTVTFELWKMK